MSIKIGLKEEDIRSDSLLRTVYADNHIEAKILVDIDHIIQGTFVHYKYMDKELVWIHSGDDDPQKELGLNQRFSVIVICMVKESDGAKKVQYIRGPKQFNRELLKLNKKYGTIRGLVVRFVREDGDFAKYSIVPTGKTQAVDEDSDELVEEFLDNVFTGTSQEIADWLQSQGVKLGAKSKLESFEREEL